MARKDYIVRTYNLSPDEIEIIKRVSLARSLYNDSATLRQIIREWHEMTNKAAENATR